MRLPAAHATDGGGSIRIPAACCGLVGLKPSRGRNPQGPDVGEGWSGMSAGHVVSRSVRDSAAFLDAFHGPAPGDPYAAPHFEGSYLERHHEPLKRLKIAVDLNALTGMAGFAIDDNPVPEEYLSFELPDSNAWLYSIGGRYKVNEQMELGLSLLYDYKESRTVTNGTIMGEFTDASALLVTGGINYKF